MKVATRQQIVAASAFLGISAHAFTSGVTQVINTRYVLTPSSGALFMSAEPLVEEKAETKKIVDEAKEVASELKKDTANAKEKKPAAKKNPKKKASSKHPDGVFSPAVRFASIVMGDERLVNIRKKVINMHSDTIRSFVDTSESEFGDAVLRAMFKFADKDGNGTIDKEELASALRSLGFSWIDEKQTNIVFKRVDKDKNGSIDLDEWMIAAPMTLKTNLIKLAKQNGEEMGLLTEPVKREIPEEKKKGSKNTNDTVSPVVLLAKAILSDDAMKKDGDTIEDVGNASSTEFGDAVLRGFYRFADKEQNGVVDEKQIGDALKSIGFSPIALKSESDESVSINMDEWLNLVPTTLRDNLIKFAEKNIWKWDFYGN